MVQIAAEKGANTPFLPSVPKCNVKAHCNDHETTLLMKKLIVPGLVAIALFSLSACASNDTTHSTTTTSQQTTVPGPTTTTTTDTQTK
jgi:hypothetical protein